MIITTEGAQEDREKGLQLGADAYVSKPIQSSGLLKIITEILEKKSQADSLTTDPPRIKIDLSFVGTGFNGFQLQKNGRTVQGELESALDEIGFPPKTVCCSRTDGGVHARRYTAHCADHEPGRKCSEILKGLNRNLPETILANAVSRAAPGFHARYSSLEKTYRYFIYVGDAAPPPVAPSLTRCAGRRRRRR